MKSKLLFLVSSILLALPVITSAQADTTSAKKDTALSIMGDSTAKIVAPVVNVETAVVATPMNCYKQWFDYFSELGSKTVPDGTQLVVIAFKSKESCHCYLGKVEVVGGKIKAPLYVETEGGDYKTFTEFGKKLDPDFLAVQGDGLWAVSNGMSVVFQTTDHEYGRIFFYKFLNKNKQMSKEAPPPSELLK